MHSSKQDKFNFFVPATFEFEKGKNGKERGLTKIKGIASSAVQDSDEETLIPTGFDYAPFLTKGILNYNHQSNKTSGAIVGEPTHAEVINDGKDFYIEGVVYPNEEGVKIVDQAEIFEKYSPNRRFGFSIEGQALKRDPLNPKKILEARITGCAITAQPKNPNTLMSIVKGEYTEPFVEEEEEPTEEKSMDVAAVAPTQPESVQHAGKIKQLTKAQIYESIMDKYSLYNENFEFINNIYNFVKSVNEKYMADSAVITPETLEKALSILDTIAKGEKSAAPAVVDIQKSEDADPIEMAKAMYSEGKSKEECIEGMIRKGLSLAVSQTSVESAITAINTLKENGGTVTPQSSPLVKAEDVAKLVLADMTKSISDTITKSVDPLTDNIKKGFGAVNELFKSQEKENEILKSTLNELAGRLEKIEKEPLPVKSARNVAALDKFNKSNSPEALDGFRQVNVLDPLEKSIVLEELSTNFDLSKSDTEREMWGKALRTVEAVGLQHLDQGIAKRMKIQLVAE